MKIFMSFFLLLATICSAQIDSDKTISINGTIVSSATGEKLAGANVFISSTFVGTMSGPNGEFELKSIPLGEQTLVVSTIGFEKFSQNFHFTKSHDGKSFEIRLYPKTYELNEVEVVTTDPEEWQEYFEIFQEEFLGTREYGDDCKILNPYAINFKYDEEKDILNAYSDSLLVIDNYALGYKIKLLLKTFKWYVDSDTTLGTLENEFFFSNLEPKDEDQEEEWIENRRETYDLSPRCFFQELIADTLIDIHKYYVRQVDLQGDKTDLRKYRRRIKKLTIYYDEDDKLYHAPSKTSLVVIVINGYQKHYSFLRFPNNELLLRPNGIPLNTDGNVILSGYWADFRISDALPSDYNPNRDGEE